MPWYYHCAQQALFSEHQRVEQFPAPNLLWQEREGKISIVEVLGEVYPFAGDGDLAKMLQWISEEPVQQGVGKLANRRLAVTERDELAALFQM